MIQMFSYIYFEFAQRTSKSKAIRLIGRCYVAEREQRANNSMVIRLTLHGERAKLTNNGKEIKLPCTVNERSE